MASRTGGRGSDSLFTEAEAKLTIYALANGMELVRQPGLRRLTWYSAGKERGIALSVRPGGSLEVTALAWTEDIATAEQRTVGEALGHDELAEEISSRLDAATEAANTL